MPLQLVTCLLVYEGLNYAVHRAMHELPGPLGIWLWRVHAAHHLPQLLYLVMHAIISHFNVDMRMGWANYLFVGPELHRYHHSARPEEAGNYGSALSVFDQLFGTFVYRPGVPPRDLGVPQDAGLPEYDRTLAVMALPFRRPGHAES